MVNTRASVCSNLPSVSSAGTRHSCSRLGRPCSFPTDSSSSSLVGCSSSRYSWDGERQRTRDDWFAGGGREGGRGHGYLDRALEASSQMEVITNHPDPESVALLTSLLPPPPSMQGCCLWASRCWLPFLCATRRPCHQPTILACTGHACLTNKLGKPFGLAKYRSSRSHPGWQRARLNCGTHGVKETLSEVMVRRVGFLRH